MRSLRRRLGQLLGVALTMSLVLAGLTPFTFLRHAEAQFAKECYVAQQSQCTRCVETGGWWQCEPFLALDYAEGFCTIGGRECDQNVKECYIKLSCSSPPQTLGGDCSTEEVTECVGHGL